MKFSFFSCALILVTAAAIILRLRLPLLKKWKAHEDAWDKRFTFIAVAIASAAAIWTIYDTSKNVADNTTQGRVAAAFAFVEHLDDRGLIEYSDFRLAAISSFTNRHAEGFTSKFNNQLESNHDMVAKVDGLLGNFEDMSIGIKSEYMDEKVLYYELANITLWSATNLAPHIQKARKLRGTNYLDEFDDLVQAWGRHQSLLDGHVFVGTEYDSP